MMVSAAVSPAGVSPLCFLQSTVSPAFYQDILEHAAKGTDVWFSDHSITVLDWPANSPDLTPSAFVKRETRETPEPTMRMT